MPNFVGQPLGSVTQTVQDAGLRVGNVTTAPAPEGSFAGCAPYPASMIVSQNPARGRESRGGRTVNFEVR